MVNTLSLITFGNGATRRALIRAHHLSFITHRWDRQPTPHPSREFGEVVVPPETNGRPIFGIVAAITKNGVIGADGGLPWNFPISIDRDYFVNFTRDRILIVGRKTFANEDPTGSHVRHVRLCIVVSRTMDASDVAAFRANVAGGSFPVVRLARSFEEALDVASDEIASSSWREGTSDDGRGVTMAESGEGGDAIRCWVGGGEGIYREAIRCGPSEVHITHVDVTLDRCMDREIAYFPLECLTEHGYVETSRRDVGMCSFRVYERTEARAKS